MSGVSRRAVICDFGGVLTSPLLGAFAAVQDQSGASVEALSGAMTRVSEATGTHPLSDLEKGLITESHFLSVLEAQIDGEVSLRGFRETYFSALHPNEAMIDYMAELSARGLRTALLTNNVREWEPLWRAKLPQLDRTFEVVVDSAFVGMRKPEPEIYELTVERLGGVTADDCVFIDDTEVNCAAARELGMYAVRFVDSESAIGEVEAALGAR
ncbi:MAG: HAD family phosphatase [Thermoleophilaceae bacterium]|nr:HAD family phosphatase [Thermoleophilaceae bacterium]